jgi:DNA modification methylase
MDWRSDDGRSSVLCGDVLERMEDIASESVQCCVTSPPYFGLRNYGADGQIGLEPSPEAYVAKMVEVFRGVRRVLRNDGTLWLNLGDSYFGSWGNYSGQNRGKGGGQRQIVNGSSVPNPAYDGLEQMRPPTAGKHPTIKPKDLVGIPWRVAFALQADGWYLRQDIIWHKPNPMPESVTDRCTKAHEYIFLLAKSERYFYDAEAVKEASVDPVASAKRYAAPFFVGEKHESGNYSATGQTHTAGMKQFDGRRNRRSVWTITTKPYSGAHFATFPPDLIEPCILAGTSAEGCCSNCRAPLVRQTSKTKLKRSRPNAYTKRTHEEGTGNACANDVAGVAVETLGWAPSCDCAAEVMPCTVLDPFAGSGTTLQVARHHGRNGVGIELNPDYIELAKARIMQPLKAKKGK